MAKDQFSFDIVSEVDMQEIRNAVDQAAREIANGSTSRAPAPRSPWSPTRSRWPPAPRTA